jgi:hypothetical protein
MTDDDRIYRYMLLDGSGPTSNRYRCQWDLDHGVTLEDIAGEISDITDAVVTARTVEKWLLKPDYWFGKKPKGWKLELKENFERIDSYFGDEEDVIPPVPPSQGDLFQ